MSIQTSDADLKAAQTPAGTLNLNIDNESFPSSGVNAVQTISGVSFSVVNLGADNISGAGTNLSVTLDQTRGLTANISTSSTGPSSSDIELNINNATSFVLGSISESNPDQDFNDAFFLSATACVSADLSAYSGFGANGSGYNFQITINDPNPVTADSITSTASGIGTPSQDFWAGPFSQTTVDAILAAYVAGNSSGSMLTIGGTSSAPSAAGLASIAILNSNGMTVMTN